MSIGIGSMFKSPLMPGLEGTVVNVNVSSGMWGRAAPTFDVLWSDMQCSRRLSQASLEGGDGSQFEMLPRRTDATECARLWHAYQIHRVHQMADRAAARQREESAQTSCHEPARGPVHHSVAGLKRGAFMTPTPVVSGHVGAREVAAQARHRLAEQIPGVGFAVTCSRSHLDVSWIDGPLEGFAWRVLADLREHGLVSELRMRRSLSAELIQRAIDYCLDRVFKGEPTQYARLRVTPDQYSAGGLSAVMAEASELGSSMSYQSLVRCVLARWDDARHRFVNTAQTRGLIQEMALLFPDGDQEASHRFQDLSMQVGERESVARQLVQRVRCG